MQKTITPIDNSVYVERPYASSNEIETALEHSNQIKITWKNTSLSERKKLISTFVDTFLNNKKGVNSMIIHRGIRRWFANGKDITIYPSSDWYDHEKSLIHEAAHAAFQHRLLEDRNCLLYTSPSPRDY